MAPVAPPLGPPVVTGQTTGHNSEHPSCDPASHTSDYRSDYRSQYITGHTVTVRLQVRLTFSGKTTCCLMKCQHELMSTSRICSSPSFSYHSSAARFTLDYAHLLSHFGVYELMQHLQCAILPFYTVFLVVGLTVWTCSLCSVLQCPRELLATDQYFIAQLLG